MNRNSTVQQALGRGCCLVAVLTLFGLQPAAEAAFLGSISGWVKDDSGMPQMGAAVAIFTPDGRLARRVFTDHSGAFDAKNLPPGEYALNVSLARFLPLIKQGIEVIGGRDTLLDVHLRGLFSSLQLVYPAAGEIRDMTDNWKWALRTAHATRPALRFLPNDSYRETDRVLRKVSGAFTDTHGYAELSGGAGVRPTALANHSDLGTSFAVATSVFGENNLRVSGNLGYNPGALTPSTAFRTTYQRDTGMGAPEVSVTVRQLQMTSLADRAFFDPHQANRMSELETFTVGFADRFQVSESTQVEYGVLYESVNFIQRLDFFSPYGKIVHQLTPRRKLEARYASGAPHPDLSIHGGEQLRQDVTSLGMFPRVALQDGRATVQRTEHIELAYREELGDSLVEAAVYQDVINDAALSALAPSGYVGGGNLLPDMFTRASTINGGRHFSRGYRVSYARKLRDRLEAALGYGSGGVVTAGTSQLSTPDLGELRNSLGVERAHIVVATVSASAPKTNTNVVSSYQWVSRPSVMAADVYNDFAARSDPGWNVIIRQPVPFSGSLPGKLEATADFRNLFSSGYTPIQGFDGQTLYLLQAVRTYRGSLSFIF